MDVSIDAPAGAKVLVVTVPPDTSRDAFHQFESALAAVRKRLHEADLTNDWPVLIPVTHGVTVEWIDSPSERRLREIVREELEEFAKRARLMAATSGMLG